MSKLTSFLYKLARISNDLTSLSNTKKTTRRVKNKIIGRTLGKMNIWKNLWK